MINECYRGALIVALLCVAGCAPAAEAESAAKPSAQERLASFFADNVAVIKFIGKAKEADAIADPLERCLAFPDFPVQDWVAGTTNAHCDYAFGGQVHAADLDAAMKSGDFASVDAAFARDLERHFSKSNFSEAIHRDFAHFDGSERSDAITKAWLSKSPKSAFAWSARGTHFLGLANGARGGRTYGEMDDTSRRAQSTNAGLAIHAFQTAIAIEPRLMPAYVQMASAAMVDSRDDVEWSAIHAGQKVDPLCSELANQAMFGLQPKWGGSKEAMKAYAATLEPHLRERPLLAFALVISETDGQCLACQAEDWRQTQAVGSAAALRSSSTKTFTYMAIGAAYDTSAPRMAAVSYALEASRFSEESVDMLRGRGFVTLYNLGDPAWAKVILERGLALDPKDGNMHLYLGMANRTLKDMEGARAQFELAQADEKSREAAIQALRTLTPPGGFPPAASEWIAAPEAIKRAAAAGPAGEEGVYAIVVAAADEIDGHMYLFPAQWDPKLGIHVT